MLHEETLHPTDPSFPAPFLNTFGNDGVLSYKVKCVSIGFMLYVLGAFVTIASNTFPEYIKDYVYFVCPITGGVTLCLIIHACKQINPTIVELDQTVQHSKKKEFKQFVHKINHDRFGILLYYVFTLGFSTTFAILGYTGVIGPPWVKAVSQSSAYINRIYYILWCAAMGYILGCGLNRLIYYSFVIDVYCKKFVLPEKINMFIPRTKTSELQPLGMLGLRFNIACTMPTVLILTAVVKVYLEGRVLLLTRPIYAIMTVVYLAILILIFFFPLRNSHYTLKKAKEGTINHLNTLTKQVADAGVPNDPEGLAKLNSIYLTVERIKKTTTWPLNFDLLVKLLATIMFPIVGGAILQILFEYVFKTFI